MVYSALSKKEGFQITNKTIKAAGKPPRQAYSKEFRESSVKMVLVEGLDVKEAATRLGVETGTLKRWVKKEQMVGNVKDHGSMKNLLVTSKKLEEENRRLKMEREILKKAMAYFIPAQN
jgi:transposase